MAESARPAPDHSVIWRPQPGPQSALITCPIFEVFYGGARGGGKTDGFLGDFAIHADKYGEAARGVFFRRRSKDLKGVIDRGKRLFGKLGVKWIGGADRLFRWPNGAELEMAHLWDDKDADTYLGRNFTRQYIEEATQWPTPGPVLKVMSACRSAEGVACGVRLNANPGGHGHEWVKARYVSPAPLGYKILIDPETGIKRVFIPSRLEHNPILMQSDPTYEARVRATAPPHLREAWRHGNWDIVPGGYFADVWVPDRHILPHKAIDLKALPPGWKYRRSFDWGQAKPSSLGLWAISDGNPIKGLERHFPRGSAIRIGEWYTVKRESNGLPMPNIGLRIVNGKLGAGILERSKGRTWSGCVADPSIFTAQGGDSIYEQLKKGASAAGGSLLFSPADNTRIAGWAHMHELLDEAAKMRAESPGMWVLDTCTDFIRTVPALMADEKDPDDIDTEQEDHAADDARYLSQTIGRGAHFAKMTQGG